jgi:hypothetical protein
MATFVGDHRFEAKILRIGIALERFGIDGKQVLFGSIPPTVLGAARLAVNVPIFYASDEPKMPRDTGRTLSPRPPFRNSQEARRRSWHVLILAHLAAGLENARVFGQRKKLDETL